MNDCPNMEQKNQMVKLFNQPKQKISSHINNYFKENELESNSVVKESLTIAEDDKEYSKLYSDGFGSFCYFIHVGFDN